MSGGGGAGGWNRLGLSGNEVRHADLCLVPGARLE